MCWVKSARLPVLRTLTAVTMRAITLIFLLFVFDAVACTCIGNETLDEALNSTDIVFKGVVKEIEVRDNFNKEEYELYKKYLLEIDSSKNIDSSQFITKELYYQIEVEKTYKGRTKNMIVTIQSGIVGADDCKYRFEIGKTYFVFAEYERTGRKFFRRKNIETDACQKNQLYTLKKEKELLKIID
ncbi:MAG: hypothetical protein COA32_02275 [Fluviicola sp.]|nr:MAG: hypothetical protein COA32_02275 [Fluviicola sp.]